MDNDIATFLAFTGTEDAAAAKQYLEISGNNVEYAVQLFLENGAHPAAQSNNDEEVAQRLQSEAYLDNVREADADVHRHETLLDSFLSFTPMSQETDIFGRGPAGVFNQRYDMGSEPRIVELDSDEDYENEDSDDLEDDEVMEIDEDGEPVRESRLSRSRLHRSRMDDLTATQRRLAELFKPPFELMDRTNLDGAKAKGRREQKWILVNIQDQAEFQCQVLNRDFWLNPDVRYKVKQNFVFLQYQHDSPNGELYLNFYRVEGHPHLAILDPMTGERVRTWTDGVVPAVDEWLADVDLFLEKYSLVPGSANPAVKNDPIYDPDAMTEEQQLDYAMRQSLGNNGATAPAVDTQGGEEAQAEEAESQDPFDQIQALEHTEPAVGTRIQFRFPNGKRLIHKFSPEEDTVHTVYEWLKYTMASDESWGISASDRFSISSAGSPKLIENLQSTVAAAGLKNASVLVEKE